MNQKPKPKTETERPMNEMQKQAMEYLFGLGQQTAKLDVRLLNPADVNPIALVPQGMQVVSLADQIPARPDRKRVHVQLRSVASFVEYVNEHKGFETRVFASMDKAPYAMTAAIDYHAAGALGEPSYITHLATLTLHETDEWKRWSGNNEKPFDQVEFAYFLENNLIDIVEPESATLMEVALSLQAKSDGRFTSANRLQDGATHFEFKADINAKAGLDGSLEIPEKFTLHIPVFRGVPEASIEAHFRYRLNRNNGELKLFYQLIRPQKLVDTMVETAIAQVKAEVGLPVFDGTYQQAPR
jgi:uncharacterized protein YfdQ (DUF2303 family)